MRAPRRGARGSARSAASSTVPPAPRVRCVYIILFGSGLAGLGFPVLRALSLCTCCRHYPGAAAECIPRSSHPAVSAFPDSTIVSACTSSFSRFARRSLTLRPAHSRGHQFVTAIRGLQTFRHLHASSGCFRRERIAGWALHPLEKRRLVTAQRPI